MTAAVLDASALLALLKAEPGGTRVAEILASSRMSAVNYAEIVSHFVHVGMPLAEVESSLNPLPLEVQLTANWQRWPDRYARSLPLRACRWETGSAWPKQSAMACPRGRRTKAGRQSRSG